MDSSLGVGLQHGVTAGAAQLPPENMAVGALQDDALTPDIEALLTHVVNCLRADWLDGPAKRWIGIYPVRKLAISDFDKYVSTALFHAFSNFSQFIAGLDMILLECEKGGIVGDERALRLRKHLVNFGDLCRDRVEIAQGDQPAGGLES